MKPKSPDNAPDLCHAQFSQILNLQHRWAAWPVKSIGQCSRRRLARSMLKRPSLPTRLMVGLHSLKYAYNESTSRYWRAGWLENPYWQYFCGYEHLQHELSLHPTSLVKWQARIGAERLGLLLTETINTARRSGALKRTRLARANVDTSVAKKAIAFPTDARFYHEMRLSLVREAQREGMALRQSYRRLRKRALARQRRYAHA